MTACDTYCDNLKFLRKTSNINVFYEIGRTVKRLRNRDLILNMNETIKGRTIFS